MVTTKIFSKQIWKGKLFQLYFGNLGQLKLNSEGFSNQAIVDLLCNKTDTLMTMEGV